MEAVVAAALAANEISQQTLVSDRRAWVAVSDPKIHQDVFLAYLERCLTFRLKSPTSEKLPLLALTQQWK
jgi:hypothetical protein